jgi:PEGA domain
VLSDPAGALAPRPAERLASQNAEQIAAKSGQQPVAAKPPARGPRILVGVVLGLLGLAVPALIALRAERAKQTQPKPPAVQPSDNDPSKTPKPSEAKIIRWHIESEPTGAEIYQLDTGELLGKTPFRAEQPARTGTVELELRKEGYQPLKLQVAGDKDAEPASQQLVAAEPEVKPTHKRDRSKHGKK